MNKPNSKSESVAAASLQSDPLAVNAEVVSPKWGFAVSSGIMGWVLDAFDFFVLVFLVDVLAKNFSVNKSAIVWTITITLVMRPVGALILGSLADRFGRRRPLIACVLYFSAITALTPFAPNYTLFVVLRALYGIGMGGFWGIGASLVMESSPKRWRGLFSGIMQAGYSVGYLLAAVAIRTIEPHFGWRYMFLAGLPFAALIAILTFISQESTAWKKNQLGSFGEIFEVLTKHKRSFAYLVLLMTAMTCLSHGTQDLYPDFLKSVHHFSIAVVSNIAILYNIGAIAGALVIGHYSDRFGRRRSIMLALLISLLSISMWSFGSSMGMLAVGSFIMQFGVQGAFGVIPAHLNELSPDSVRSLFPGVAYQLGMLIGAPSVVVEFALQRHLGYRWALAGFEICIIIALLFIFGLGPEKRGRNFST
jgi:SHS family lactate transporter-like MFS transporter